MSTERSYWIKSGFFTLMQQATSLIFGVGSFMILTRALSEEKLGLWVLFLLTATFFEQGRVGLQQNALVKFLTTAEGQEYRLINTASLCLNLIVTTLIAVLLFSFAKLLSVAMDAPSLYELLLIYCLTNICLLPFFQFNFVQQANLHFDGIFWSNLVLRGGMFAYIAYIYFFSNEKFSLVNLAIARTIAAALAGLVSWIFARKFLQFDWNVSWDWVWKLFQYGKFTMGTNLSTMLYKQIDRWMLSPMMGLASVGLYEVAMKITNYTEAPTFAAASMLLPQSARRMKEGKQAIRELYEKTVGGILTFIIPVIVLVLLFAEVFIWILAGDKFPEAPNVLRCTIFFGLFIPYAVQFGVVLDSTGRPQINFWYTIAGAIINIISNYIFINMYGVYGAVIGTMITYATAFAAMQFYLNKTFGIIPFRAFKYMIEFYGMIFQMGRTKIKTYLAKS